jgi:uncharacterized membrane protein YidH (DUF202 family)
MTQPDDPEDLDPGLARERTRLARMRTAISFTAVGVVVLRLNLAAGLTLLATAPVIWLTGRRVSRQAPHGQARPRLLLLIAVTVAGAAFVVLVVVLGHGQSPGFHPPSQG